MYLSSHSQFHAECVCGCIYLHIHNSMLSVSGCIYLHIHNSMLSESGYIYLHIHNSMLSVCVDVFIFTFTIPC